MLRVKFGEWPAQPATLDIPNFKEELKGMWRMTLRLCDNLEVDRFGKPGMTNPQKNLSSKGTKLKRWSQAKFVSANN